MGLNVQKKNVLGEMPVRENMKRLGKLRQLSNSKRKRGKNKERLGRSILDYNSVPRKVWHLLLGNLKSKSSVRGDWCLSGCQPSYYSHAQFLTESSQGSMASVQTWLWFQSTVPGVHLNYVSVTCERHILWPPYSHTTHPTPLQLDVWVLGEERAVDKNSITCDN